MRQVQTMRFGHERQVSHLPAEQVFDAHFAQILHDVDQRFHSNSRDGDK